MCLIVYQYIFQSSFFTFQPENLLLASKAKGAAVKLADFGLAIEVTSILICSFAYSNE